MPSINDDFADAIEVTIATDGGTYTSDPIDTAGNTTEAGEPNITASANVSAWWSYTPSSSGTATFDTQLSTPTGSSTDTYLAIWAGTNFDDLVLVAADDDSGGSGTSRIANLAVTGGETYWLQVGGYGLATMNVVMRVTGPATGGGGTTPVTATRATSWDARAQVGVSRVATWAVRSLVAATRAAAYDVLERINRASPASWDVRRDVTAQRSTAWNVDSALESVTAMRGASWRSLAAPQAARVAAWSTRAALTAARVASWDVRERVAGIGAASWRTLLGVASTRAASWRTTARALASRSSTWRTESDLLPPDLTVGSARQHRYTATSRRPPRFAVVPAHARDRRPPMSLYADDPDVHEVFPVTDANGGALDFTALVRVTGYDDIEAAWLEPASVHPTREGATVRELKVPLAGLAAGFTHSLRLVIDGDNDVRLGSVVLE